MRPRRNRNGLVGVGFCNADAGLRDKRPRQLQAGKCERAGRVLRSHASNLDTSRRRVFERAGELSLVKALHQRFMDVSRRSSAPSGAAARRNGNTLNFSCGKFGIGCSRWLTRHPPRSDRLPPSAFHFCAERCAGTVFRYSRHGCEASMETGHSTVVAQNGSMTAKVAVTKAVKPICKASR